MFKKGEGAKRLCILFENKKVDDSEHKMKQLHLREFFPPMGGESLLDHVAQANLFNNLDLESSFVPGPTQN